MLIEEIGLSDIRIPRRSVNFVLMQPHVNIDPENEPFKWIAGSVADQLKAITRTLQISNGPFGELKGHAHFTVFPEYSIPGVEGVKTLHEAIKTAGCIKGRVVLGCVDGLLKDEFLSLRDIGGIAIHGKTLADIKDDHWINCVITWVKDLEGNTNAWVQPKLVPARPEKRSECKRMLCGDVVHLFKTKFDDGISCRFLSLICFDWIGDNSSGHGVKGILAAVNQKWDRGDDPIQLSFVFFPQYNPEPSDDEFMENTKDFFVNNKDYPLVERSNSVVVISNVAGDPTPGKMPSFGCSAFVFHPKSGYDTKCCEPTFAVTSKDFPGRKVLGWCVDARLREMGPCIHSVSITVPQSVTAAPSGRTFPIETASVFPIDTSLHDPRLPSTTVAASVKWTNDHLDTIEPIVPVDPASAMRADVESKHKEIVDQLRWADARSLRRLILLASSTLLLDNTKWIEFSKGRRIANIDLWDSKEAECLRTVVHAMTIMGLTQKISLDLKNVHASIELGGSILDIIVVTGDRQHAECYEHALKVSGVREQAYLLVVTKDLLNRRAPSKRPKFTQAHSQPTAAGPKFTDPTTRTFHIGFQDLDTVLNDSATVSDLTTNFMKELGL